MLATIKFVNDRRSVMGRRHAGMYESYALLQDVKSCVSEKTNRGRDNQLTENIVLSQLPKAEECLRAFPIS